VVGLCLGEVELVLLRKVYFSLSSTSPTSEGKIEEAGVRPLGQAWQSASKPASHFLPSATCPHRHAQQAVRRVFTVTKHT